MSNLETRIAEADDKLELVVKLLKKGLDADSPDRRDLALALQHASEARSKLRGEL